MLEAAHGIECRGLTPSLARAEPALQYEPEVDYEPKLQGWSPAALALSARSYSIRLARPGHKASCALCGRQFLAAGPTGFRNEEPVCDPCLLEQVEELGMVLAMIAVVRVFAVSRFDSRREYVGALYELGGFARIYERVAARSGPPRIFEI